MDFYRFKIYKTPKKIQTRDAVADRFNIYIIFFYMVNF